MYIAHEIIESNELNNLHELTVYNPNIYHINKY